MQMRFLSATLFVLSAASCAAPPSAVVLPSASPSATPAITASPAASATTPLAVFPSADPASLGTKQTIQRALHIPADQRVASYSSDPPTSGPHHERPATWSISDAPIPNEVFVHNLEHGGIVLVYNDLDPADVTRLRGLVTVLQRSTHPKLLLFPYQTLKEAKIAVLAWGWLLKLPEYDPAKIRGFIEAHYEGPDAPERSVP